MSFEQHYDARREDNYPPRGKRQGGFTLEQVEPKPPVGLKARPSFNRGTSVWDAMHHHSNHNDSAGGRQELPPPPPSRPQLRPAQSSKSGNQRRDPIGYFDDEKFGGSMGQEFTNLNPGSNFNQNINANTRENYNPSWSSNQQQTRGGVELQQVPANELLENAMKYQKPILSAEDY